MLFRSNLMFTRNDRTELLATPESVTLEERAKFSPFREMRLNDEPLIRAVSENISDRGYYYNTTTNDSVLLTLSTYSMMVNSERNGGLGYSLYIANMASYNTVTHDHDWKLVYSGETSRGYSLDLTGLGYEDIKVENGTWAQTYDVLISTIKACTDNEVRYQLMHIAEDMLMDTGCIIPLYFYTDIYMLNSSVDGFFSNPLGYKYFMYCTVNG